MTTRHLFISIPDILHGITVEWEHLEFKAGWKLVAVRRKKKSQLDTCHL